MLPKDFNEQEDLPQRTVEDVMRHLTELGGPLHKKLENLDRNFSEDSEEPWDGEKDDEQYWDDFRNVTARGVLNSFIVHSGYAPDYNDRYIAYAIELANELTRKLRYNDFRLETD